MNCWVLWNLDVIGVSVALVRVMLVWLVLYFDCLCVVRLVFYGMLVLIRLWMQWLNRCMLKVEVLSGIAGKGTLLC